MVRKSYHTLAFINVQSYLYNFSEEDQIRKQAITFMQKINKLNLFFHVALQK